MKHVFLTFPNQLLMFVICRVPTSVYPWRLEPPARKDQVEAVGREAALISSACLSQTLIHKSTESPIFKGLSSGFGCGPTLNLSLCSWDDFGDFSGVGLVFGFGAWCLEPQILGVELCGLQFFPNLVEGKPAGTPIVFWGWKKICSVLWFSLESHGSLLRYLRMWSPTMRPSAPVRRPMNGECPWRFWGLWLKPWWKAITSQAGWHRKNIIPLPRYSVSPALQTATDGQAMLPLALAGSIGFVPRTFFQQEGLSRRGTSAVMAGAVFWIW